MPITLPIEGVSWNDLRSFRTIKFELESSVDVAVEPGVVLGDAGMVDKISLGKGKAEATLQVKA
jgi:hypothetical protein